MRESLWSNSCSVVGWLVVWRSMLSMLYWQYVDRRSQSTYTWWKSWKCNTRPTWIHREWKYVAVFYYPRDAMLARVIEIAMCLSVCPSVTRRYCVKTKIASGMISSPSGSPKTLVFWRQISSPNSKGFPPNGGFKQGSVWKIQRFCSFKCQYLKNGSRYGQSYN